MLFGAGALGLCDTGPSSACFKTQQLQPFVLMFSTAHSSSVSRVSMVAPSGLWPFYGRI